MPQPFLGFSLQRFPLTGIARPSRGRFCSPAVIHRRAETLLPGPCHRRFRRLPRFWAQLPGSPDDFRLPFHAPRCASRSPWIQAAEPLRSASFTRLEALILPRVRSRRPKLPRVAGRSSPGFFASLKPSPSTPRDPWTRPGHEDLNMPLRPKAPGHDSRDFDTPPAG
jgi:hypothetical protein